MLLASFKWTGLTVVVVLVVSLVFVLAEVAFEDDEEEEEDEPDSKRRVLLLLSSLLPSLMGPPRWLRPRRTQGRLQKSQPEGRRVRDEL